MKRFYFIFILFILNCSGTKTEKLLKNLNCKYLDLGVDIDNSGESLDLLFDYKIYKQLIKDNILDELIKKSGFEPNEENRLIFFAAISKDLQKQITKSFESTSCSFESNDHLLTKEMLTAQSEMTRSLTSAMQSMALTMAKPASSGKFWLIVGGIFFILGAEFGWFKNFKEITDFYTKTKEKTLKIGGILGRKLVEVTPLEKIVSLDYLDDHRYVNQLEQRFKDIITWIKDDKTKSRHEALKKANKITFMDKNGKQIIFTKTGNNSWTTGFEEINKI